MVEWLNKLHYNRKVDYHISVGMNNCNYRCRAHKYTIEYKDRHKGGHTM